MSNPSRGRIRVWRNGWPLVATALGVATSAGGADFCNWQKRSPEHAPAGVVWAALAYDSSRGVTVMYAASKGGASETWEWDGKDWSFRESGAEPYWRENAAMVYDSARGVCVLAGGKGLAGDTWEWNGQAWSGFEGSVLDLISPAMVYDSQREVTVLFGGKTYGDAIYGGTVEWNGSQWSIRHPEKAPSARFAHMMAYDSLRGVTVLHGGVKDNGFSSSETWEWDGQQWTYRDTGPTKSSAGMVYDSDRRVCFLFGGSNLDQGGQETWTWDGEAWTLIDTPDRPSPAAEPAMAYDSKRKAVVMYAFTGPGAGQTWEYVCKPSPPCYPDLDGNGVLDLFDFLTFANAFNAGEAGSADCDQSQSLDLFDFLCFTNAFNAGC